MHLSQLRKSLLHLITVLFTAGILYTGCSLFNPNEKGGGTLVLTIDEAMVNAVKGASRAAEDESSGWYLDVDLLGGYTSNKTIPLVIGQEITFEGIPVNSVVHIEADLYKNFPGEGKAVYYDAKSADVKIGVGYNKVSLKLKKNKDSLAWANRFYVSAKGNGSDTDGDGSYEKPFETISKALSKMDDSTADYLIKLDGQFNGHQELSGTYDAASITLMGMDSETALVGDDSYAALKVSGEKPVTIRNLVITHAEGNWGPGLVIGEPNSPENTTRVTLGKGAVVKSNKTNDAAGAGVIIKISGKLILDGGEISGNGGECSNGSAIYAGGNCEIKDGIITKNNGQGSDPNALYVENSTLTMTGGSISSNDLIGVYITNGTFDFKGGSISGNKTSGDTTGIGVYVANYDTTLGHFKMSGKALIKSDNVVKLKETGSGKTVLTVSGPLSGKTPVATILPSSYTENDIVLEAENGISLSQVYKKFAVLPDASAVAAPQKWLINSEGKLQKPATGGNGGGGNGNHDTSDFVLVEGTMIDGQIGAPDGSNLSRVFIQDRKVSINDIYVCKHEVTQKEFFTYMLTWKKVGEVRGEGDWSSMDPSDEYGKGDNYPINTLTWYQAILYCNARSKAEGLEQVYYLTPEYEDHPEDNYIPVYDIDEWTSITKKSGEFFFRKYENETNPDDPDNGKYYVRNTDRLNSLNHPLVGIKMDITKNGYRLLTEAEWEYCARGGKDLVYSKYSGTDDVSKLSEYAWYYDSVGDERKTHEVMQKKANNLGLFDMCGNVYEWCFDVMNSSGITADTPETGYVGNDANDTVGKVCRGGSYSSNEDDNYNHGLNITTRFQYTVESMDHQHGIRLCRTKTD